MLSTRATVVSFFVFVSATPNPAPEAEQKQAVIRVLEGQWLDKKINDQVGQFGKQGRITCQKGYAPPRPTPSPSSSPAR